MEWPRILNGGFISALNTYGEKQIWQTEPNEQYIVLQLMEIIWLDFLKLEMSKCGLQHVFVITDHFIRCAQAIPTKDETAKKTAEAFFRILVVYCGLPK